MELFNYYDNFVVDILMRFSVFGTTKKELDSEFKAVFGENADKFYDKSEKNIADYYGFFRKDGTEVTPLFDSESPVLLNKIEREAIVNAVKKPIAKVYLSDSEISTINAIFNEIPEWDDSLSIAERFKLYKAENGQIEGNIKVLIKAIIDKKEVTLTNITRNVSYENQVVYPLRLEFTAKDERWTLTVFHPGIHRVINMNVLKLKDIVIGNTIPDFKKIEHSYQQFLEKNKKMTAVIKLKAKNYDLDRFFRTFSYYKRTTKYDKKTDEYTIELEYYLFDENALFIQLLSFGNIAEVISPLSLRERIIEELL